MTAGSAMVGGAIGKGMAGYADDLAKEAGNQLADEVMSLWATSLFNLVFEVKSFAAGAGVAAVTDKYCGGPDAK